MKRYYILSLICGLALSCWAQTQQGYVKTLGRADQKGVALSGVSVRVKGEHNPVLSKADGTFSLSFPDKKNGDTYSLLQVQKSGYELNEMDVIGRKYALSDKIPLTIVMVSKAQLQADKQRIENKAFQTAEKNYHSKLAVLENQKKENAITIEQYQSEIQALQSNFEKYQSLIDGLAEHYAHVDYDVLDEKEREINICIENGELERAEALLNQLGIQQRIARIEQQLASGQRLMDEAQTDMAAVLKQQEKDAEYLYQLYTISFSRFDNTKAAEYLSIRAELDTANIDWQFDVAKFFMDYLAEFDKSLAYYKRALRIANRQEPRGGLNTMRSYNMIGNYYLTKVDTTMAMTYYRRALSIGPGDVSEQQLEMAQTNHNIGVVYLKFKEYNLANEYLMKALLLRADILGGENYPEVAQSFNTIAMSFSLQKNYKFSLDMTERALNIWQSFYGEDCLDVAQCYSNMADDYISLGNHEKAQECFDKALAIERKVVGEQHPKIGVVYNDIGFMYTVRGRAYNNNEAYQTALDYFRKSSQIFAMVYGMHHPNYAMELCNIGFVLTAIGKYGEALPYYEEGLSIYEDFYSLDHEDYKIAKESIDYIKSKLSQDK